MNALMKYPEAYEHGYTDEESTLTALAERGESLLAYKAVAIKDWRAQIKWWKERKQEIIQSSRFVKERTQTAEENIAYFYGRLTRLEGIMDKQDANA